MDGETDERAQSRERRARSRRVRVFGSIGPHSASTRRQLVLINMQLLTFPILWALAVVQRVDAQFLRLSTNYLGDAEASMTVPQIIRRWDYPVEIHQVETADGYIVTLHRIPHGRHGEWRLNGVDCLSFN